MAPEWSRRALGKPEGGGSVPPRGSKILTRKLGESEAECDPKLIIEEVEEAKCSGSNTPLGSANY